MPWVADLFSFSGGDLELVTLLQGPLGLVLDGGADQLRWTPTAEDAGVHRVHVRATAEGDTVDLELDLVVIGRRLVVEALVGPAGGFVQVDDPTVRLVGASLSFPMGALTAPEIISVSAVDIGPFLPPGSMVMDCSPSQVFSSPVTVTMPFDALQLAGVGSRPEDLRIHVWDETMGWLPLPGGQVDLGMGVVRGETEHFSRFALIDIACSLPLLSPYVRFLEALNLVITGSGLQETCVVTISNAIARLNQPRRISVHQGDGVCEPEEKTAIVVHGILSNSTEFLGPGDLIQNLSGKYDNILAYDYPSGHSIYSNGLALARMIHNDVNRFRSGAIVDIYAHSMGGLVSRVVIQDPGASGFLVGRVAVANLLTLATPHRGSDLFIPNWISSATTVEWVLDSMHQALGTQGARDLIPTSQFIQTLNAQQPSRWTKMHCVAGTGGTSILNWFFGGQHDNAVPLSSALPVGLFPIVWQAIVPQDHNAVHTAFTSGSGPGALQVIEPKRFYDQGIAVLQFQRTAIWTSGPDFDELHASATVGFASDFMFVPGTVFSIGVGVTCSEPTGEQFVSDIIVNLPVPVPSDPTFGWFIVPEPISGTVRNFDTRNYPPTQFLNLCTDVLEGVTLRNVMQVRLPGDPPETPFKDYTLP